MQFRNLVPVAVATAVLLANMVLGGDDFGPDDFLEVYGFGSNTTTAPNVNPAKQLKKGLLAGGYIPFAILIAVSSCFRAVKFSMVGTPHSNPFSATSYDPISLYVWPKQRLASCYS